MRLKIARAVLILKMILTTKGKSKYQFTLNAPKPWQDIDMNGVYLSPIGTDTDSAWRDLNENSLSTSASPLEIKIDADGSTLVNIPSIKMILLNNQDSKSPGSDCKYYGYSEC